MTSKSPSSDDAAVADYEEIVHNAPPEAVEQIHVEAFEQLTTEQRDLMFEALTDRATSDDERPASAAPADLARAATQAELRRPGTLGGIASGRDPFGVDSGLLNLFVAYAVGSHLSLAYLAASPLPDADGPAGFGGGFDGAGGFDGF